MNPILEYLFRVAPVAGVMALWIFFLQRQINADKKIITQQNAEYKDLLERVIIISSSVLDNSANMKNEVINEIQSLRSFIELKIAELN